MVAGRLCDLTTKVCAGRAARTLQAFCLREDKVTVRSESFAVLPPSQLTIVSAAHPRATSELNDVSNEVSVDVFVD